MGTRYNDSEETFPVSPNIFFHREDNEEQGNLYLYTKDENCYLLNGLTAKRLCKYLYAHGQRDNVNEILDLLINGATDD